MPHPSENFPAEPLGDFIPNLPAKHPALLAHTHRLLESYRHWLGKPLLVLPEMATDSQTVSAVFFAPFVLVSGGTEPDQILNYANRRALDLWEYSWDEMTRTPSRLTAEPMHREARARFLEEVRTNGFIENYEGIRISKSGRRFRIEQATVWNLLDDAGHYAGQAAMFEKFSPLP
ncbi:MAG: MEKHLA domain-containing protein [Verrucomicrobiae bacterium]|nr:MEKHLA domain-containing protein [Verrucomicrobiae bacterium]